MTWATSKTAWSIIFRMLLSLTLWRCHPCQFSALWKVNARHNLHVSECGRAQWYCEAPRKCQWYVEPSHVHLCRTP